MIPPLNIRVKHLEGQGVQKKPQTFRRKWDENRILSFSLWNKRYVLYIFLFLQMVKCKKKRRKKNKRKNKFINTWFLAEKNATFAPLSNKKNMLFTHSLRAQQKLGMLSRYNIVRIAAFGTIVHRWMKTRMVFSKNTSFFHSCIHLPYQYKEVYPLWLDEL